MIFVGLFFLSACKKEKYPCDCSTVNTSIDSELQYKWVFKSFENLKGKKETLPSGLEEMHIEFNESDLSIKGQNNSCYGGYENHDNNCLKTSNLACTEVGGTTDQMEWEGRYISALNNVECYKIENNKLKLYYQKNSKQMTMNFEK